MKKTLCLIIDSVPHVAWQETYETHRRIWNKCLDLRPEVEGYFLYSDPSLPVEHSTEHRRFTVRGEERLDTIFDKTIQALQVLLNKHHYVIRTNVSSLWDFELLQQLKLPRENLYTGHVIPWQPPFVTGSGMVLSRDAAEKLSTATSKGVDPHDDIAIAQALYARGVHATHRPWLWFDYARDVEQFTVGQYLHYRLKDTTWDPERRCERKVTEAVFAKVYPNAAVVKS